MKFGFFIMVRLQNTSNTAWMEKQRHSDKLETGMSEKSNNSQFDVIYILKNSGKTAVIFAIIWGIWAWWINSDHGTEIALRATRTQIAFTIVNAFVYSLLMEGIFFAIRSVIWRNITTFIVPNVIVTVLLISIHTWRGTPNVLVTAAAPLAIVFALSLAYIFVVGPRRLKEKAAVR